MHPDDLSHRYRQLRHELDAAYADAVWDSRRIDRIADELAPLERQLAIEQGRLHSQSRPPAAEA